jgi:hypothetical protein
MKMTLASPRTWRLARGPLALVFGVMLNLMAPATAHAQLAPLYNQLMNTLQQMAMKALMAKMGLGIEGAVAQAGAATQGEIMKKTMAEKAVAEGLESYRQQENLRRATMDTMDSLQQPVGTCATMATQGSLGNATQSSRAKVVASQDRVLKQVTGNTNTLQALDTSYKTTNDTMCTAEEQARGICRQNTAYKDLAGADQNAAFLFQGKDGSPTFDGAPDGPQAKAADSYIARIVAGLPPEQLKKAEYNKSPASRGYIELMRRYAAVLSMSAYSLNQIKESHTPQIGLGTNTTMATVNVPGFTPNKADMSMQEAVQRYVATKFSPDSMRDAAKATSENLILRDMAQMNAFQLWIDHQTLLQDSRTESLMAHQLALLTEQTLRPTLDAQRLAATRAGRQQ